LNLLLFGMKIVKRVFQRLKRMPEILAALSCMFMIFGPVFLVAPLIPSSSWTYEDRPISYQELWLSGGGALWAGGGIVMISLGAICNPSRVRCHDGFRCFSPQSDVSV
jgi:hypothetical protein